MNTTTDNPELSTMLAKGHKEFAIASLPNNEETTIALRAKYANLPAVATREGYEAHRVALGQLVKIRTAIEKRRKELKQDSIDTGRRIDAFAKHCTAIIEEIENPIRTAKALYDEEQELKRLHAENEVIRQREEVERLRREREEAKIRAEREAEEARLKVLRDAEDERIRAEAAVLAAERAKFQEERRTAEAKAQAERDRIDAEQKVIQDRLDAERAEVQRKARLVADEQQKIAQAQEAERVRLERVEWERLAKERAEQEARDKLERERIEAERVAAAKAKADREDAERAEAELSDTERVRNYGKLIASIGPPPPSLKSAKAIQVCKSVYESIVTLSKSLEGFTPHQKKGSK